MALDAHLKELAAKHNALETQIKDLMKSPAPDDLRLAKLKKQKLHLKDEIASLKADA